MDPVIRPVDPADREAVMRLAPRLLIGVDPSRRHDRVRSAVDGWLDESVRTANTDGHAAWVADLDGSVVGFVSIAEEDHWSGEPDGWVGELIVDEAHERRGIARSLLAVAERWAAGRGLGHIRLSTGAANHGARAFYEQLGYGLTEVTLTRRLAIGDVGRPHRSRPDR